MSAQEHAGLILYDPSLAGGDRPELVWRQVAGRPLVAWTVRAVAHTPALTGVALLVPPQRASAAEALAVAERWERVVVLAARGPGLAAALAQAIEALPATSGWVVSHDLARPLVTPELLVAGLAAAGQTGASSAFEPVKETVKRVDGAAVVETLERSRLGLLQTPQVFERGRLAEACARYPADARAPDAATIALASGLTVAAYPGSPDNLAVRSEEDLRLAERLLLRRHDAAG